MYVYRYICLCVCACGCVYTGVGFEAVSQMNPEFTIKLVWLVNLPWGSLGPAFWVLEAQVGHQLPHPSGFV